MRELLNELASEEGAITCSGAVEIYPDEPQGWWALGGPSLLLSDEKVLQPSWCDDSMWDPRAPDPCESVEFAPPEDAPAADKPKKDEDQTGAE